MPHRARSFTRLTVALAVLLVAPRAETRGDPRLELELGFGVSGSTELRTVVMTSPLLTLTAPVTTETGFLARWGFTIATGEPTDPAYDSTYFAAGNPLFGWSIVFADGLVFTPALTLPLARRPAADSRRPASSFALEGGLGLRGAVDQWLWRPDQLALVFPLAYVTWLDPVLVEAHAKVGLLIPTTSDDADTDFIMQPGLRLAIHLGAGVWVAARLTGVYTPTDTGDNFQGAVAPELRYVLGPGSHLGVTLMMNLDSPYGPFTEPGRFWGVHLTGSSPL